MWRQYRVGCVVYNVHKQVIPESCHYLTTLHAHSHPCLVSLLFIPSLNSKNFLFTCSYSFIQISASRNMEYISFASIDGGSEKLFMVTSIEEVKKMIIDMEKKFDGLKIAIKECLKKHKVPVERVADALTSLSADEDDHHKMFLESHVSVLFKAADIPELFGTMNFHWNYLSPPPLDHLVQRLDLEEVKGQMEAYKSVLQRFRMKTSLPLFCQSQRRRRVRPPGEFHEMVAEFDWPDIVTLEVVEQFREEYASHYNLRECAMLIAQVRSGSFIVTWLIPQSIIKKLKAKIPRGLLKQYSVTRLEIAGVCVYRLRKPQEVSFTSCISSVS